MTKCKGCGKEFGTDTRIDLIAVSDLHRATPINGIEGMTPLGKPLYDLDYDNEVLEEGEVSDYWYACGYCGETIPLAEVESIVRAYGGNNEM